MKKNIVYKILFTENIVSNGAIFLSLLFPAEILKTILPTSPSVPILAVASLYIKGIISFFITIETKMVVSFFIITELTVPTLSFCPEITIAPVIEFSEYFYFSCWDI